MAGVLPIEWRKVIKVRSRYLFRTSDTRRSNCYLRDM